MKAWFISDIHIKFLNERNSQYLLRFLLSLQQKEITHLFLVGDIFDFWVGDDPYFAEKFEPLVSAIQALQKNKKVEVIYFEGNHDVHIYDFWEKQLGCKVFHDDQYFKLGTKTVRVSHGDLINPTDLAYQRWRKVYRHKLFETVVRAIPGKTFDQIGEYLSQYSRKKSSVRRRNRGEDLRAMIRTYAEKSYQEKQFDYIITGHMHVKDEYDFQNAKSVNLGSWFDHPQAFWISEEGSGWESVDDAS